MPRKLIRRQIKIIHGAVHQPGCEGTFHEPDVLCGGTYTCAKCKRQCGWCYGSDDSRFELCDQCWAEG